MNPGLQDSLRQAWSDRLADSDPTTESIVQITKAPSQRDFLRSRHSSHLMNRKLARPITPIITAKRG